MLQKILTIDFDIVMGPSIQLYNDIINDNKGIDKIIKQYPLLEYTLTGDFFVYEALTRELVKFFKNLSAKDICFIREHHSIINELKSVDEYILYNVDHHHDLGYNTTRPTSKIIRPDCGNWVKYLYDQGKIKEYVWICNENSDFPMNGLEKTYLKDWAYIKETDFRNFKDINKLIICNSPQWVPPNFQALFMSWIGLAEEYYETEYKVI